MQVARKVALVTGAAHGLGRQISEGLLRQGARVCVSDWNSEAGRDTVDYFKREYGPESTMFQKVDVRKIEELEESILNTKLNFGKLDIMCNCAGFADEERMSRLVDINLRGVMNGNLLAIRHMSKTKKNDFGGDGGVVINISSVKGLAPVAMSPMYTATKYGIVGLTRAMALTHAKSGVRFNCVCPSYTRTDMFENPEDFDEDYAKGLVDKYGIVDPSYVSDAVRRLIEDVRKNGHVLIVSKHRGIVKAPMPSMDEICGVANEKREMGSSNDKQKEAIKV